MDFDDLGEAMFSVHRGGKDELWAVIEEEIDNTEIIAGVLAVILSACHTLKDHEQINFIKQAQEYLNEKLNKLLADDTIDDDIQYLDEDSNE